MKLDKRIKLLERRLEKLKNNDLSYDVNDYGSYKTKTWCNDEIAYHECPYCGYRQKESY